MTFRSLMALSHAASFVQLSSRNARRPREAGVTLIEVLIAILVLSIGFIGMAALQLRSLSTNDSAMTRSMAIIAGYTILDAMRTDRDAVLAGSYDVTGMEASDCPSGSTLAATQLEHWCQQLGDSLGATEDTQATIACSPVDSYADCTVTIQFDDSRAGQGGDSTQTITVRTRI